MPSDPGCAAGHYSTFPRRQAVASQCPGFPKKFPGACCFFQSRAIFAEALFTSKGWSNFFAPRGAPLGVHPRSRSLEKHFRCETLFGRRAGTNPVLTPTIGRPPPCGILGGKDSPDDLSAQLTSRSCPGAVEGGKIF